jgi:ABC-type dipeptide/oligopeptide/nickel transport system permease component
VPAVFGVSVVVFSIVHLLPGDAVLAILSGANTTPAQGRELRAWLRLDIRGRCSTSGLSTAPLWVTSADRSIAVSFGRSR